MHAGARVVRLTHDSTADGGGGTWAFEVVARFVEHESMNYGSDVQPIATGNSASETEKGDDEGKGNHRMRKVVSTSFYDKRLCLWEVELPNAGRDR